MTHIRVKLLVGSLILIGAVVYLAVAGVKKGWVYYLPVHEYLASEDYRGTRVRLAGDVLAENLDTQPGMLLARFAMSDDQTDKVLAVAYHGPIPDMFKPGAQVVIEGREDADGVFQADVLMTKCASKYEEKPAEHAGATEDGVPAIRGVDDAGYGFSSVGDAASPPSPLHQKEKNR